MPNKKSDRKCSVLFCGDKHHAKGYCQKHYDEFCKRERKDDHKKYNRKRDSYKGTRKEGPYKEDTLKKAARAAAYRARKYSVEAEIIYSKDVFEECNWICGLCGFPVDKSLKYPNKLSASLDHIIPLAKGGKHVRSNVQLTHLVCNMSKGTNTTPTPKRKPG